MIIRKLGSTGLEAPAVGFGGMRFGDIANLSACSDMCLRAYDMGIRYFDTAPGYFGGKSEEVFGRALAKKHDVIISTKSSKATAAEIRKDLLTSLKRLRREKIPVFHIWWVLTMSNFKQRVEGGAIDEALKMKAEGLFDHLFISTHMEGADIIEVMKTGYFEGVTMGLSALNFQFRQSALEYASKNNIAVAVMNPLAGGLIPKNPKYFSILKRDKDKSITEGALNFVLSQPGVSVALVGMEKKEHIDEAVNVGENYAPWSAEEISNLKNMLSDKYSSLCTGCGYCKGCPEKLEVSKFMLAYNKKILSGKPEEIKDSLQWEWAIPYTQWKTCAACGACEKKCTQHLNIVERMKEIAKL